MFYQVFYADTMIVKYNNSRLFKNIFNQRVA